MAKIGILIVEDEPIIAADLQDRLEEMGYEVLGHFTSGEQVLQWIDGARRLPDLILMDINLEGALNGVETMRLLQKQHRLQVIFLTSNSDDHTFEEARAVHPRAFLTKPFNVYSTNFGT